MQNKDLIQKLKKLRALAQSKNNVNEAATAFAMFQKLLEEHQIEEALLLEEDQEESLEITKSVIHTFDGSRVTTWVLDLAGSVCRNNGCKCYYRTGTTWNRKVGTISAVGTEDDLNNVRLLISWLVQEINRLYKEEKPAGLDRGEGRSWANSFRNGAVWTIGKRMSEAKDRVRTAARNKPKLELLYQHSDAETILLLDSLMTVDSDPREGHALPTWAEEKFQVLSMELQRFPLVRVETAIEKVDQKNKAAKDWVKKHLSLKSGSQRSRGSNHGGFEAGAAAGHRANLNARKGIRG